jgi:outer membrane protein assembly factor BamB/TolA-binding protein
MISAEQFLAALEEKELVPKPLIASLRKQLAQAASPVPATVVAKKLIDKGQLTAAQAKRILESPPPTAKAPPADDDYGLAPLDDEPKPLAPEPPKPLGGMKKEAGPAAGKRSMKDAPQVGRPSKLAAPIGDIKADLEKPGAQHKPDKPAAPAAPAQTDDFASQLSAELSPIEGRGDLIDALDDYGVADEGPVPKAAEAPKPVAPKPAEAEAKKAKPVDKKAAQNADKKGEKKPERLPKKSKPLSPKLLALGGLLLLVVVAIGGVAAWTLTRPTGDDDLQAAESEFQAGRYADAVQKYNDFLAQFPQHKNAGLARVHRGLAQLKQAVAAKDDRASLAVAKQVLGEMAAQAEFAQAGNELATILTTLAEGLARQVRKTPEAVPLTNAKEALALAKRYVPRELRRAAQLAELDLAVALGARDVARPAEMEKAVAEIRQALGQGKIVDAYARRTAILKTYPDLADEPQLRDASLAIAQAEKGAVAWTDKKQPAQTGEAEGAVVASVVPFGRNAKSAAPGGDPAVVYAVADGSVFALDAASGKLLWQRSIGYSLGGRTAALVPLAAGSDCILADVAGRAVVRVEATSGKLRWRQTLEQPVEGPLALAGNRVLAATRAGRVYAIDAESGTLIGYTQLPQGVDAGPAVLAERGLVFLLGQQGSLYVLSAADGKCRQVIALGHEPGSVAAAPVVVGKLLLVATNDGLDEASLRALSISSDESAPLRAVQTESLKGHVDAAPSVAGSRVVVATDVGAVYVYDTSGADDGKPLKRLGEQAPEGPDATARYALLQPDRLWVAGAQLARYSLGVDGQVENRQTTDVDSTFLQAPAAAGGAVVSVRRCGAVPGARVAALNPADSSPLWETHVGAPLVELLAADGALAGVTGAGVVLRVDPASVTAQTLVEQRVLPAPEELVGPVTSAAALDGGRLAFAGQGARTLWIYEPKGGEPSLRRLTLADAVSGGVMAFAGGVLVPGRLGQVALIDAKSGDKLDEPFQPLLPGGLDYAWCPGAVAQNTLLLADGRAKLYAIEQQRDPKPHLKQVAEVQAGPIVSPVAVAGQVAYAADVSGTLAPFGLPKLERGQTWPLGSRCVWGPCAVGKRVLVASAAGKLLCLDDQAKLAWQVELSSGPPAGRPLEAGGAFLLVSSRGQVLKVDAASGKQLAKLEVGRALASGPVSLGGHLFVGGADGTLYKVKQF